MENYTGRIRHNLRTQEVQIRQMAEQKGNITTMTKKYQSRSQKVALWYSTGLGCRTPWIYTSVTHKNNNKMPELEI